MRLPRHIHVRVALLALVALAAVGTGAAFAATRAQTTPIGTGAVVIDTNLAYQGAQAAGTGIVLTSSGEILTNNHVIAGATTIAAVVPGTRHRYVARVVGYDPSADVAVLQLRNASNLRTSPISTGTVAVGRRVTAVGNANGAGTLASAPGTVTGVARAITARNDQGGSERLTGLIETNADLQPGDSGGPLLNAAGQVVGMDTAASAAGAFQAVSATTADAYAIPIAKAVSIAKQIEAGRASSAVHVGATAFLGVEVSNDSWNGGVTVVGVVANGPAATAGLASGDAIVSIGGRSIASPHQIQAIVLARKPGTKLAVAYTDGFGASRSTTVTLGSGPAQ